MIALGLEAARGVDLLAGRVMDLEYLILSLHQGLLAILCFCIRCLAWNDANG
jgi:hypothetical protein